MPDPTEPGTDKDMHAHGGAAFRLGTEALMPEGAPWYMTRGVPVLGGVAKEVLDSYSTHHTPDKWDAVATALGALLMYHSGTADRDFTMVPTISPERMAVDLRWRF
jgi:hypothetical protein